MMEFIAQNMAPIMFASLIIFLLIGYPVAFSLAANGLMFFFIGVLLSLRRARTRGPTERSGVPRPRKTFGTSRRQPAVAGANRGYPLGRGSLS